MNWHSQVFIFTVASLLSWLISGDCAQLYDGGEVGPALHRLLKKSLSQNLNLSVFPACLCVNTKRKMNFINDDDVTNPDCFIHSRCNCVKQKMIEVITFLLQCQIFLGMIVYWNEGMYLTRSKIKIYIFNAYSKSIPNKLFKFSAQLIELNQLQQQLQWDAIKSFLNPIYKQKRPFKNFPSINQLQPILMDGQFIIQQYENFQSKLKTRQRIRISLDPKFQAELDMMEYVILSRFQKNAKNLFKEKKNKHCDKLLKKVFKELVDVQKIYYYNMIISHLQNITNQDLTPPNILNESIKAPGYSKTYSKIGWKQVHLKVDFDKRYLYVERDHKLNAYDLNFYLIRKSKATEYNCFVLEAINEIINEKGQQIHVGFKDVKIFRIWFDAIRKLVEFVFWQKIRNMIFAPEIVEMFQTKAYEEDVKEQKMSQEMIQKMCQSTYTTSQKFIELDECDRMTRSLKKIVSQNQSERSHEKSCQSIQIKSHSPRSSLKQGQQVRLQCEQNSQDQGNQTFRSFAQLTGEDVEDFNEDESVIFHKLFPEYQLDTINAIGNHNQLIHTSGDSKLKIYSNTQNAKRIKVFVQFSKNLMNCSFEQFAALFCTPQFYKQINNEVQELNTKTILTTDKCAILYQKNKCYNRLYRSRDFVLLRHQFRRGNQIFIIDKSVQDANIPPFTTIVRGQLSIVYSINQQNDKLKLTIDAIVENFGYLKDFQQLNINIKFFKGFQNIQTKIKQLKGKSISPLFEPLIKKVESSQNIESNFKTVDMKKVETTVSDKTQQQQEQPKLSQQKQTSSGSEQIQSIKNGDLPLESERKQQTEQTFQEIQKVTENIHEIEQSVQKMEIEGQISMIQQPKQQRAVKIYRKFDQQGKVIVEDQHLFKKHQIRPEPADQKDFLYLKNQKNQHPIWKGNWQFLEQGGLKFINKKQIQDQKGVLKFIFSQVAKNLVSGKSILNISLPVDIFSSQSNLQRFIFSMGYAPCILQPAVRMNELDRFLQTIVFGMTNSPMYLEMQKPFNPILGETFQGYINGCPAYGQQISHHPPVAAFMLIGRGYRVSAQIQSKMKLNINSGTGSNVGVFRIKYDDENEICYICPSGEVSGLAYGDRKFNMIGKAYGWSQKSGIFLQISFNPKKGGFFQKQSSPVDYFEGRVQQVKESFLKSFVKNGYSGSPKKSDIVKQMGKFHGRWNKQLRYEDRLLFSYDTQFPLQLEYESWPLPSDANWREDITYRRLQQITAAQTWKEKLQIQQRNQRKLREQYSSGKK